MKHVFALIALAAAVTGSFTACQTTSTGSGGGGEIAKADVNNDGKFTRDEASDYFVNIMFTGRDLNHDGSLTWAEWNVPGAGASKAKFKAADKNNDGNLSVAEAKAYARKTGLFKQNFDSADTNHDGVVTRAEAQAYYGSTEGHPR